MHVVVSHSQQMWKRAANSMSRGLNMGGNGITHALVEGNVESLQLSIGCAPRNVRAKWLCQVVDCLMFTVVMMEG